MKQRITFIQPEGTGIDPNGIHVNPDTVVFSNARSAALEKRLTLGLEDLPAEISAILEQCHELHIRWSAPVDHAIPAPFASRLPAGLHVFFTPLSAGAEVNLCPLLQKLFGADLKCSSTTESFTRPSLLSETFSSAASYQYFHVLPSLQHFNQYLQANAWHTDLKARIACENEAEFATFAASLDVDYDAISHAVSLSALWSADQEARVQRPGSGITDRAVVKFREEHRFEVGVLTQEKAGEVEELALGGYLAVLGEHDRPSPTMFSFPSRHHPLPATSSQLSVAASFQYPTGLHPKLDLTFPASALSPPQPSCALHAYLTLPSALFIDRYQFSDALFLQSQNLVALRALSGEQDLEAPDWVVDAWGSVALFEIAHPEAAESSGVEEREWTVTIPTHLRYVRPDNSSSSSSTSSSDGKAHLAIPAPIVFWACNADEGTKFNTNPFDRANLGYDGLFGTKTMFYHVPPAPVMGEAEDGLLLGLEVPVLDAAKSGGWVGMATVGVVVAGSTWVVWKVLGGGAAKGAEKGAKKDGGKKKE